MITIEQDVFGWNDTYQWSNETFVVTADLDERALVAALDRAARRFVTIDQEGHEHPSMEAAALAERFTPSYVSDPEVTPHGVRVYVDASGGIDRGMAEGLKRVLREELERVTSHARVSAAP